ncbi:hypothetical protein BD324DRAFT_653387 [Kockovaella imperatae]|uniref:Uncharacterized protein n=1 Tax=Kockovaella imperatae TaxID=4999 RepID=A0A1Y1U7U9_9TREE|nr:hypothetical protein BD324DRAFT_653387 [Kockovaella imperatae]ORX34110.1 hypothetical protein BD324DRAFT_653387 [Kockovaella imperatae]
MAQQGMAWDPFPSLSERQIASPRPLPATPRRFPLLTSLSTSVIRRAAPLLPDEGQEEARSGSWSGDQPVAHFAPRHRFLVDCEATSGRQLAPLVPYGHRQYLSLSQSLTSGEGVPIGLKRKEPGEELSRSGVHSLLTEPLHTKPTSRELQHQRRSSVNPAHDEARGAVVCHRWHQGAADALQAYAEIREREDAKKDTAQRSMAAREAVLAPIDGQAVRDALYELLNAPPFTISHRGLGILSHSVQSDALRLDRPIVDDQGNPYSEYILMFVNVFLILFRPVSSSLIPLKTGVGESGENDETDQKAFGALTATSLASRVLILIPHTHHHILRCIWFALTFLGCAYAGSKRGVAVKFLLDRLSEEWTAREARGSQRRSSAACRGHSDTERRIAVIEAVWLERARRVDALRMAAETTKQRERLRIGTVWLEMKGLAGQVEGNDGHGSRRAGSHDPSLSIQLRSQSTPLRRIARSKTSMTIATPSSPKIPPCQSRPQLVVPTLPRIEPRLSPGTSSKRRKLRLSPD